MKSVVPVSFLAMLVGLLFASNADACGRRSYCAPVYCDPCHWQCCQPDTAPLNPQPPHPLPRSATRAALTLSNPSSSEFFVVISLRHQDPCYCHGVFRNYWKTAIGVSPVTVPATAPLYLGDEVLVQTWWREAPDKPWHCWRNKIITLQATGTYDVLTGLYH
jgi:hypothetical protein